MSSNQISGNIPATIAFNDITFIEEPTDIVQIAVREYEKAQVKLKSETSSSQAYAWSFLAHQVVGHEVNA